MLGQRLTSKVFIGALIAALAAAGVLLDSGAGTPVSAHACPPGTTIDESFNLHGGKPAATRYVGQIVVAVAHVCTNGVSVPNERVVFESDNGAALTGDSFNAATAFKFTNQAGLAHTTFKCLSVITADKVVHIRAEWLDGNNQSFNPPRQVTRNLTCRPCASPPPQEQGEGGGLDTCPTGSVGGLSSLAQAELPPGEFGLAWRALAAMAGTLALGGGGLAWYRRRAVR